MTAKFSDSIVTEQQAQLADDRELRFRVADGAHCRTGWQVEIETDRRPLALLTDPQWNDMFWVSYAYSATSDIPEERAALDTTGFWTRYDLLYRSRDIDLVAPFAFAALRGPSSGRISIRGLYLAPEFSRYERFLLWLRRRKHRCCIRSGVTRDYSYRGSQD